jgi:hypothetical protein
VTLDVVVMLALNQGKIVMEEMVARLAVCCKDRALAILSLLCVEIVLLE